jgi:diacylglycerol O-acyltransferase / wax synthase
MAGAAQLAGGAAQPASGAAQLAGDRLSSSDSAMFLEEDLHPNLRAGVGMVYVFEGPTPTWEQFIEHFQARVPGIPRLRQRVAHRPGRILRPVWAEDLDFRLSEHLRAHDLPAGDFDALLQDFAGTLYSERLRRERPVWEAWLVRQAGCARFAVALKIHHALADGVTLGQYLTPALFGARADEYPYARPGGGPESDGGWRIAALGLRNALLELLRPAGRIRGLTRPHSSERVLRWRALELGKLKLARGRRGGTVNDVYLTVVADALRQVVDDHGGRDVHALVPVTTRTTAQASAMGNRMSLMRVRLPMAKADLSKIHSEVARRTEDAKASHQARGALVVLRLEGWVPERLLKWCVDSHTTTRFFHIVVSNIRGAAGDFRLGEGRLVSPWIVNYLPHDHRFVVTALSFEGDMNVVILGDRAATEQCEQLLELMAGALEGMTGTVPSASQLGGQAASVGASRG